MVHGVKKQGVTVELVRILGLNELSRAASPMLLVIVLAASAVFTYCERAPFARISTRVGETGATSLPFSFGSERQGNAHGSVG